MTLIGRPDAQKKTETAGLEFAVVGEKEFPAGSLAQTTAKLGRLAGLKCDSIYSRVAAARRSHSLGSGAGRHYDCRCRRIACGSGHTCRRDGRGDAAFAICFGLQCAGAKSDPSSSPGSDTVALSSRHNLALAQCAWRFHPASGRPTDHSRDQRAASPTWSISKWQCGFRRSGLAQIAQQPAFFDYPRERLPDNFHYTGPWHALESGDKMEFPWEKLDGPPINIRFDGNSAESTSAHLSGDRFRLRRARRAARFVTGKPRSTLDLKLAGAAIVVPFAPQLELLRRAALTITHAGLNTALESLGPRCADGGYSHHKRSAGSRQPSRMAGCCQDRAASAADCASLACQREDRSRVSRTTARGLGNGRWNSRQH